MAARVWASDRPWMITVPPAARALANVARVRRSPVETELVQRESLRRARSAQSSKSADWISVMPAPYGIRFGRHVLPGVARGLDRGEKRVDLGRPRTS